MILGCIGMNIIIALLSTFALLAVTCRRFETFSFVSLLLFSATSLSVSFMQIVQIYVSYWFSKNPHSGSYNYLGGYLVV